MRISPGFTDERAVESAYAGGFSKRSMCLRCRRETLVQTYIALQENYGKIPKQSGPCVYCWY